MKGLTLNISTRIIVILLQLINIKLYTNNLTAENLGIYFFLLAISYSANAFLFVPLDYYQQANLARLIKETGSLYAIRKFNINLIIATIITISLITLVVFSTNQQQTQQVFLAMVLSYFLYATQTLRNTLNNLGHGQVMSVSFIYESVIKVAAFISLTYLTKPDSETLILSWIIGLMASIGYLLHRATKLELFKKNNTNKNLNILDIAKFSYPFSIGAVCNWLQLQGYRLVLVPLGFSTEVGLFATISSIGTAVAGVISLIYSQQFTPIIYKSKGAYTVRYIVGATLTLTVIGLLTLVTGEVVVKLLTNSDLTKFWELMLFGLFIDGANILISVLAIHITLTRDTASTIPPAIIGLLVSIMIFGLILFSDFVSPYTIGIPLLISQLVVVYFMMKSIKMNNNQETPK